MKITEKEIIADEGMKIRRIGSNSEGYVRCTKLPNDTEATFEEAKEFVVIDGNYDERVNALIRERYTESQEFAIIRQQATKPDEFKEYFDYCEECKAKARNELN